MTRLDYMRTLGDEELIQFIYVNAKHFKLGIKRFTLWLEGEMETYEDGDV